tara:strand:+ start:5118 stop:5564 length:447 start_codon:yes stop_codon:yes gene_type:complete
MGTSTTVTVTVLSKHMPKIKAMNSEGKLRQWSDEVNHENGGAHLTSLTFYEIDCGNMDDDESELMSANIPYDYDVDRTSEFDSIETVFRVDKDGNGRCWSFSGNERNTVEVDKLLDAYVHGTMQTFIKEIYDKKIPPSWKEQDKICSL